MCDLSFSRGFCYFNNVALAAKAMLAKNRRVMIVDWVSSLSPLLPHSLSLLPLPPSLTPTHTVSYLLSFSP